MFADDLVIRRNSLVGDHFDGGEILFESGALDFAGLLGEVAFGDKNQMVAFSEILQSFCDLRQ